MDAADHPEPVLGAVADREADHLAALQPGAAFRRYLGGELAAADAPELPGFRGLWRAGRSGFEREFMLAARCTGDLLPDPVVAMDDVQGPTRWLVRGRC